MKLHVTLLAIGILFPGFREASLAQNAGGPASAAGTEETAALSNGSGEPGLMLNFREAPLDMVLDYLSEAAGFIIIKDTEVSGTITAWSKRPVSKEDAIDILNAVLNEKGYAAVENGNILKIVSRRDAPTENLPVIKENNPASIPQTDKIVTQVIPVKYLDAVKLINDIQPLIPEEAKATLAANESSNAIVYTDTQANIHRIAKIIEALDTSISSIATIRVFPLMYADATQLAETIEELFQTPAFNNNERNARQFFQRFRGRGGNDNNDASSGTGDSMARQAATSVTAVADERTNSLVVSAPGELMDTIAEVVEEVDTVVDELTELRVFKLKNADAREMAQRISDLYPDESQQQQNNNSRFGRFGRGGRGNNNNNSQQEASQRMLKQNKVLAVADPRTNSVLVTAASDIMDQIATMVEQLDADTSKKENVHVYSLKNADVDNVANILRGMFEPQGYGTSRTGRTGSTQDEESALSNRSRTGASIQANTSVQRNQ